MKAVLVRALLLGITLLGSSTGAFAQVPSCGSVEVVNDIFQGNNLYVWVNARTSRELTPCPIELQTEAWVGGVGGAESSRHATSAWLLLGRPIPSHGTWHSFSKHWLIWYPGLNAEQWQQWSNEHDDVTTVPPPPPPEEEPTEEELCLEGGGSWEWEHCVWPNCPLLVDLAGNGFKLTSAALGVRFDLDADGSPEQIAWTEEDSDDGWLALDRNNNGKIDDGTELFGNKSPAYADQRDPAAEHGFAALRFTEGPSYGKSAADDVIDAKDAVFSRLLIWRDRNHNGLSEPDELTNAQAIGLVSVSTDHHTSRRRDRFGNEFRQFAKSLWAIENQPRQRSIVDVWLREGR